VNTEIINYIAQRKPRGVTTPYDSTSATIETIVKGSRFFPAFKAFAAVHSVLKDFVSAAELNWQLKTNIEVDCTKEEGLTFSIKTCMDEEEPLNVSTFMQLKAFEHPEPVVSRPISGPELGPLHLQIGRHYKEHNYPPASIFWSLSSWFQSAGWLCDDFLFDGVKHKVRFMFIEPVTRKQTFEAVIDFSVMISDCEIANRPEPEPEPVPEPEPEYKMENVYILPHARDTYGRPLIDSGIYRFLTDGETIRWENVTSESFPGLGTTYVRMGKFMLHDKFLKRTFDLFDEYKDAGLDFVSMARFCHQQVDPNEIFREQYSQP